MPKSKNEHCQRYTLATRDIGWEALTVTGVFAALMVVWACLNKDQRLLFIPLTLLGIGCIIAIVLLFRFITEPKIAIQADVNGIYFYHRKHREMFFAYADIVEVSNYCVYDRGGAVAKGGIVITTQTDQYRSISIRQSSATTLTLIKGLLDAKDKREYLQRKSMQV